MKGKSVHLNTNMYDLERVHLIVLLEVYLQQSFVCKISSDLVLETQLASELWEHFSFILSNLSMQNDR